MESRCNWNGYILQINSPSVTWSSAPGIYIFSGKNKSDEWVALYIGQASSFSERLNKHERWQEAKDLGATHIHTIVITEQTSRDHIEQDLISQYQPCLNTNLK